MTTTFNALKIPCTTHHQAHNEACPERSFEELKCLADNIALHIERTAKLPEGVDNALRVISASLEGRRKCAPFFHALSPQDGEDRSKANAGHQKAIEVFQHIHNTLEGAVASVALKKTPSPPVAKNSNLQDENNNTVLRSNQQHDSTSEFLDDAPSDHTDDTPAPVEQQDAQPMQVADTAAADTAVVEYAAVEPAIVEPAVADTAGTTTLSEDISNVMRDLETLASIRGSIRATWLDYRSLKSGLYEAVQLSRHAFALSLGVVAELKAVCTGSKSMHERMMRLRNRMERTGAESDYDDLCCVRASKILTLVLEFIVLGRSESEDVIAQRNEFTQRCRKHHPLAYHLCLVTKLLPERPKGQQEWVAPHEETDPLLLTLRELCNAQKVTMEAAVVVQLYLEVYEATQLPDLRHFDTLVTAAKTKKQSLTAIDNTVEKQKQPPASEIRSETGRACRSIADGVIALSEIGPKRAKSGKSPAKTLYFLLTHLPLLCGSVYAALMDSFYLDGIQMSQYDSRVTAVAHLYWNTDFDVSHQRWARLENFIALQGKETLGLDNSADEDYCPVDGAMKLGIALGIPRTDFEKLELETGEVDRLPLPRMPSAGALALPMNQHSLLRMELLDTADQGGHARLTSPDQSRRVLQRLARDKMRQPRMVAAHPEIHNALERQDHLCPAQLLEILSDSLTADAQHLKFNLHDLTLSCWELLRTIDRDHGRRLRASRYFFWEDADCGKSNVVDDVIWEAIAQVAIVEDDPANPEAKRSVLSIVTPALDKSQETVKNDGLVSSGHAAKHQTASRPSTLQC
jgi:hypothetical protein